MNPTNPKNPTNPPGRFGIYVGEGTSHSWTWFVDLLDKYGRLHLNFFEDGKKISRNGPNGIDVLLISGGDTFALAEGLGEGGCKNIKEFIRSGGIYIGTCAGAYMPMNSSKEPLNFLNLVPARIANITDILPKMDGLKGKTYTPYGRGYIFHPIRGEIEITTTGRLPFGKKAGVIAPIYGGSSIKTPLDNGLVPLATYSATTPKTIFQTDKSLAERVFLGKIAALRGRFGRGHIFLYGPHLEHPDYPMANELVMDTINWGLSEARGLDIHAETAKQRIGESGKRGIGERRGTRDEGRNIIEEDEKMRRWEDENGEGKEKTNIEYRMSNVECRREKEERISNLEGRREKREKSEIQNPKSKIENRALPTMYGQFMNCPYSELHGHGISDKQIKNLKKLISNLRIHLFGMMGKGINFKVGHKIWDLERLLPFIKVIWDRIPKLKGLYHLRGDDFENLTGEANRSFTLFLNLRAEVEKNSASDSKFNELLISLKKTAITFLRIYFSSLKNDIV